MKEMFESRETFAAYATIDAGHYMFEQLLLKMRKPISPLEAMVDKATGFDDAQYRGYCAEAIMILVDVIDAKKVIEADFTEDMRMLEDLRAKLGSPLNH